MAIFSAEIKACKITKQTNQLHREKNFQIYVAVRRL